MGTCCLQTGNPAHLPACQLEPLSPTHREWPVTLLSAPEPQLWCLPMPAHNHSMTKAIFGIGVPAQQCWRNMPSPSLLLLCSPCTWQQRERRSV